MTSILVSDVHVEKTGDGMTGSKCSVSAPYCYPLLYGRLAAIVD
jgi:hypothetical protein